MSRISELNTKLFEQLARLEQTSLKGDALADEIKRSSAMVDLADQITENNKVSLMAAKLYAEHRDIILPYLPLIGKSE